MNTLIHQITLAHIGMGAVPPIMVKIIFWVLVILWALGSWQWTDNPNPRLVTGTKLVQIILFAILGYCAFGF